MPSCDRSLPYIPPESHCHAFRQNYNSSKNTDWLEISSDSEPRVFLPGFPFHVVMKMKTQKSSKSPKWLAKSQKNTTRVHSKLVKPVIPRPADDDVVSTSPVPGKKRKRNSSDSTKDPNPRMTKKSRPSHKSHSYHPIFSSVSLAFTEGEDDIILPFDSDSDSDSRSSFTHIIQILRPPPPSPTSSEHLLFFSANHRYIKTNSDGTGVEVLTLTTPLELSRSDSSYGSSNPVEHPEEEEQNGLTTSLTPSQIIYACDLLALALPFSLNLKKLDSIEEPRILITAPPPGPPNQSHHPQGPLPGPASAQRTQSAIDIMSILTTYLAAVYRRPVHLVAQALDKLLSRDVSAVEENKGAWDGRMGSRLISKLKAEQKCNEQKNGIRCWMNQLGSRDCERLQSVADSIVKEYYH